MKITRKWAMPNKWTFKIKPIRELIDRYMKDSGEWMDPFSGMNTLANVTNDINKNLDADYHMKADEFIKLYKSIGNIFFDPPYSLRQVKECYENNGIGFTHKDTQNAIRWTIERDLIAERMAPGGLVISFGWTSTCMGKKRGYEIIEILLVSHGSAHNDLGCRGEYESRHPGRSCRLYRRLGLFARRSVPGLCQRGSDDQAVEYARLVRGQDGLGP